MLVRSYGFSVTAGNGEVSLDDLFTSLAATSGDEDTSQKNLRRIFVDTTTNKDFVLGLVVTVKDQKTFCELVNEKGNFVIAVSNLKGKNKLMEFNFFVINKSNGLVSTSTTSSPAPRVRSAAIYALATVGFLKPCETTLSRH